MTESNTNKDVNDHQYFVKQEFICVYGYVKENYYKKLKKRKKSATNIIIDDGIIKIIHNYIAPFILRPIDAMTLSHYIYHTTPSFYINSRWNPTNAQQRSDENNIKVVVIGRGCVGKTSLLITYTTNTFPSEYVPTVFDNYSVTIMIGNKKMNLGLWDTAGGEVYPRIRPLSYSQTDVFIVCMDIYDMKSRQYYKNEFWTDSQIDTMGFCQEAKMWCPNMPVILVGTKTDLRCDANVKNDCYSMEEMECFSVHCKCDGYIECSAKNVDNVKETFDFAMRKVFEFRDKDKMRKKKQCLIL
eukprot:33486_1